MVTLAGMKPTFSNPFGAVLNALKASWIVKLAAVFAVGVPVSVGQFSSHPVSLSLDISGEYIARSFYQVRYNSNTNVPGSGWSDRQSWIPGGNPCVSNVVWWEYTQKYFQHLGNAQPRGFRELELCVGNNMVRDKDDDYIYSTHFQVNPRVVITSTNFPNALWTLESDVRSAVDVYRVKPVHSTDSSNCWVVEGRFYCYLLTGDYSFFIKPWIYMSSPDLGFMDSYFLFPLYRDNEHFDGLRYIRPTKEYYQSSTSFISCPSRLIFRPPDRTFPACFNARLFTCDEFDELDE